MKKKKLTAAALCLALISGAASIPYSPRVSAAELVPAFPGAEGGGMYATGGRGGSVYHVTNLNDSGAGSFRDAVSKSNRIIVFDVGGTITLKSDVVCQGNITVAGQTAPGGAGITLKGGKIGMGGDNIIVRFISSRPGEKGSESDYDAWGGSAGSNSIIDHCSIGWANDEQFGLYSKNMNQTVQYTIVGPSNCVSYHSKGAHGFGVMFGKGQNSWHHNLLCHSLSRNFRGKVEKTNSMDFVNNVIYDWGYQTAYGTHGHINYMNNYLKAGPSTKGGQRYINISSGTAPENYKFCLTGNTLRNPDDSVYSAAMDANNWNGGINYGSAGLTETDYRSDTPFAVAASNGTDVSVAYNAESAEEAYQNVLNYAGAAINAQSRTKIDAQVVEETRTGTGSLTGGRDFSTVTDSAVKDAIEKYGIQYCDYNSYYPAAVTAKEITDSDNDGMPDEWELARGLDPNNASDATGDYLGQGYNNIEYYINDLTADAFPAGTVTISETTEDLGEDYTNAKEDAEAIKLSPTAITNASELVLPTSGAKHSSEISWASSSSSITIKNNKITAIKRPSSGNESVSLLASVTSGEFTVKKYFTVTLLSTSKTWKASEADKGKTAGSKLMDGLYCVSDLDSGNSADVTINDVSFTYYVGNSANGTWIGGAAAGSALKYTASEAGYLSAYVTSLGETKSFYIRKENSDDYAVTTGAYGTEQMLTLPVDAGGTYYIYVAGSKGRFVGVSFDTSAPTNIWRASADVAANGILISGMSVNEDMTYTAKSSRNIDGIDFTGCIAGTTNPSDNGASGASITYIPPQSCNITVYYKIGSGKEFRINTADGTIVEKYKNEDEASEYTSTTATLTAGETYYIYVAGSKAEFYGIGVALSEDAPRQEATPAPTPEQSKEPEITASPEQSKEPTPTPTPEQSKEPEATPVPPSEEPELTASPEPSEETSYSFTLNGSRLDRLENGEVVLSGGAAPAVKEVYAAAYDEYGRLIRLVRTAPLNGGSFSVSVNIDDEISELKAFLWNDNMLPEAESGRLSR